MIRQNQKVLVLGATGSIGSAVVCELRQRGHQVLCLVRSSQAEKTLQDSGFDTLFGDIRAPEKWIDIVNDVDAVVPLAATWTEDMDQVDGRLTGILLKTLAAAEGQKTLIYTSGCWVYGSTGDVVATESTPHDPIAEFSGNSAAAKSVQQDSKIRGMVILPAMVYERDGGVFEPMIAGRESVKRIRVAGSVKTRWPLVHKDDLACLYALMIEGGAVGSVYNAAAIEGVEVGYLAELLSRRFGLSQKPEVLPLAKALQVFGLYAGGYCLDQQMSGKKAMHELGWRPEHTNLEKDLL